MSLNEKISTAQLSSNLQEKPLHQIGDIDIVRACGMAGVQNSLGLALWRFKYCNDTRELGSLLEGALELLDKREFDGGNVRRTHRVIAHWMDDKCHPCGGRGYNVVSGTPVLSDTPCTHCGGSGRVKFEGDDAALWLLETLNRLERVMAVAILEKINPKADLSEQSD